MAADIRERPHHAVIAANNHDAFAEIVEAPPLARLRDVAFMANHLRRCAQERPLLGLEEFGVMIEPSGQAHAVERVWLRLDRF